MLSNSQKTNPKPPKGLGPGQDIRHSPNATTKLESNIVMYRQSSDFLALQNRLLQAYCVAFPHLLNPNTIDEALTPLLQKVKHHLYHRDFAAAFGSKNYLEAYAARWSPSRSLAYLEILFAVLSSTTDDQTDSNVAQSHKNADSIRSLKVTSLGGGAGAEMTALFGLQCLKNDKAVHDCHDNKINIATFDQADWQSILVHLNQALTSVTERDSGRSLTLDLTPSQTDLLSFPLVEPLVENLRRSDLVTLMFTLNELFSSSVGRTQHLLFELTSLMRPGAMLLVVDSPGSYSTVQFNGKEKQYPMAWLLKHVLLTKVIEAEDEIDGHRDEASDAQRIPEKTRSPKPFWIEVRSDSSIWWRQPNGLKYPVPIENMRYQLHLYKRLDR